MRRSRLGAAAVALAAAVTVTTAPGVATAKAKRARWDARTASVSASPSRVAAGGTIKVRWTVVATGRAPAGARLELRLSKDARGDRRDLRLGALRRLPRVVGRPKAGSARVRIPRTTAVGRRWLVACLRPPHGTRDRRPANDCRAARLTIVAPAVQPGATPGGGPAAAPAPPAPGAPAVTHLFPLAANPLKADVTLEPANAVTQLVTSKGATLEAFGDDGTAYTLTIPAGGLFSPARITMTPVAALGSVALERLVGAVKLEPEGLVLAKPATLTMTPLDDPPPVGQQTGLIAEGDGADLHRYPMAMGAAMKLELQHFSTPGVAQLTPAQQDGLAGHTPAAVQAQYESLISDALAQARQSELAGKPGADLVALTHPVVHALFRDVVRPAMQAALTDDAQVDSAIAGALQWLRQASLLSTGLGEFDAESAEIYTTIREILRNRFERNYRACVDQHDLAAVHRMLAVERSISLFGETDWTGADLDKVRRCLTFELHFASYVHTRVTGGGYDYRLHSATIRLEPGESLTPPDGSGPLAWDTFSGNQTEHGDCFDGSGAYDSVSTAKTADPATLEANLQLDIAPRLPGAPPPTTDDYGATLAIDTNNPLEHYELTITGACANSGPVANSLWQAAYGLGIPDVFKAGDETFFTKLLRGEGPKMFTFTTDRSTPGFDEQTTVEAWHTPEG